MHKLLGARIVHSERRDRLHERELGKVRGGPADHVRRRARDIVMLTHFGGNWAVS
jgi:hypothetical protein